MTDSQIAILKTELTTDPAGIIGTLYSSGNDTGCAAALNLRSGAGAGEIDAEPVDVDVFLDAVLDGVELAGFSQAGHS